MELELEVEEVELELEVEEVGAVMGVVAVAARHLLADDRHRHLRRDVVLLVEVDELGAERRGA